MSASLGRGDWTRRSGNEAMMVPIRELLLSPGLMIMDFDDTIAYSGRHRRGLLRSVLSSVAGRDVPAGDIQKHWGKPFEEVVRSAAPDVAFDEFMSVYKVAMAATPSEATPGVRDLLVQLRAVGARVHVVSSSLSCLVEQDLEQLMLRGYVGEIWGSDRTGYAKPDGRVLDGPLRVGRALGIDLSAVLYVGDSSDDCVLARARGVRFVAVITGDTGEDTFIEMGVAPWCIAKSFEAALSGRDGVSRVGRGSVPSGEA